MTLPVPAWLKEIVGRNKAALRSSVAIAAEHSLTRHALNTVCHAAKCPNRGECFNCGDATFMVLGERCTRGCRFCAVSREKPLPPDVNEPERVAQAIDEWHIRYAVLTMPTRDDLSDGGAAHFARVINAIHARTPQVRVEPLISDLQGNEQSLRTILDARPDVLAHNIETVAPLYAAVRAGAQYARSLKVLENSKKYAPNVFTKSGFMVGLGETEEQIYQLLKDLHAAGVDLITIGQYLAPSANHYPVARYPQPDEYTRWEKQALTLGFKGVASGPLVRSSYRAGALYQAACLQTVGEKTCADKV